MTLPQLHALKVWHERHGRRQPFEKQVWDLVVTLWLAGWVGAPSALLLHRTGSLWGCAAAICLPGAYVQVRRWLHARRILRCDWISALR